MIYFIVVLNFAALHFIAKLYCCIRLVLFYYTYFITLLNSTVLLYYFIISF